MQIKITPRTLGGTEFTAQPARLHLGAQNAEGVDRLVFQLPAEWAGCSVTLHIRHSDGTLAAPLVLDAAHSAPVGRSFTGWPAGQWMLAATDGSGYTAYTRPGWYDVYDILPTDGTEEEPSPSVYEQFIAQVSGQAEAAVQAAQSSAASEASAARQAQAAANAAERAALNGSRAATSASRAESAALRAESFAPEDGTLLSVNGKGGAVVLDAFAGSGALSLEALSRGADTAVLCERDRDAAVIIERNISALRLGRDRARLVRGDVLKRGAGAPGRPFDLVFLDPPYATDPAEIFGLLGRLGDAGALADDLIVSYEHDASDDDAVEALAETSRYEIASRRHFGDTTLDLLERLCTE